MIDVIGFKRLIVLAVLLVLNVVLAYGVYQYAAPEIKTTERKLSQIKSEISKKQSDIDRMQLEFEQLDDQQAEFDALKADEFFSKQSRREAEEVFLRAEKDSGVIAASVKVNAGEKVENEEAKKAENVILQSPINVTLTAYDDTDVYRYIYILQKLFPGHLTADSLKIERVSDLNDVLLRAIMQGKKPEVVKASVDFTWSTMVPASSLDAEGGF